VRGSVLEPATLDRLLAGAEVVYHLAARIHLDKDRDGSLYAVNVRGTQGVLTALHKTGARLVHCSSHHALDREPLSEPLDEKRPLALHDPNDYHRTKAQAEELVIKAVAHHGANAVIVNPGTMIGPHDYEPSIIGRALLALARKELPAVINALSDYVDVRDVADGTIAAAERGGKGERYLLTGEVVPITTLLALWEEITGVPQPGLCFPLWAAWGLVPFARAWSLVSRQPAQLTAGLLHASVSNREVSTKKAREQLGYRPRSVRDALRGTYQFLEEQGWLSGPRPKRAIT
jgi:dihydroflavonol-4-reductase